MTSPVKVAELATARPKATVPFISTPKPVAVRQYGFQQHPPAPRVQQGKPTPPNAAPSRQEASSSAPQPAISGKQERGEMEPGKGLAPDRRLPGRLLCFPRPAAATVCAKAQGRPTASNPYRLSPAPAVRRSQPADSRSLFRSALSSVPQQVTRGVSPDRSGPAPTPGFRHTSPQQQSKGGQFATPVNGRRAPSIASQRSVIFLITISGSASPSISSKSFPEV